MTAGLDPTKGAVIELGAGTGVITQAILDRGIAPHDLHTIEMNPVFHSHLKHHFAGVNHHQMSAADVCDLGLHNVQAVISGLPLLSMPLSLQTAILRGSFAQLARDARYVQFTYGWIPPVARALRDDMGLGWERSARIWFNMPPARVYRFSQYPDPLRHRRTLRGPVAGVKRHATAYRRQAHDRDQNRNR